MRRIRRVGRDRSPIAWALATGVATLLSGCDRGPRSAEDTPAACRLHLEFQRLAAFRVWPEFTPARLPLAIFDGESTWVFGFPDTLAGFARDSRCKSAQRSPGQHENVRANSTVDWNGVTVATLLARRANPDSLTTVAAAAIHEAFHAHQRQHHPGWAADESALFSYPSDRDTLLATAKLEMETLRRAVVARDATESARWAAAAVSYRRQRAAHMPKPAIAYERANELNEGLAQYVEHRALERGLRLPVGARADLGDDLPADGVRWRCYASGEAWALLLARHVPDWPAQLVQRDSVPLDVWLAAAEPVRNATPLALDAATVTQLGAAARHAVAELREARIEQGRTFLARPGFTLVFEAASEPWWPQGFDPLNVRLLNDGAVLHGRWLRLGNSAGRIEVLDRAALSEPAGAHPLFAGVRRLSIAGLEAAPAVEPSDSALVVRAAGVEAMLRGAQVVASGARTVVRVGR